MIAYRDDTKNALKFAEQYADGSWKVVTVDATGDVGEYASLALGPLGRPFIAYYDVANGNLKIAEATSRTFVGAIPQ